MGVKLGRTQAEQMSSGLLKSGHRSIRSACLKGAVTGSQSTSRSLLDHFVGAFFFAQASRLYKQEAREVLV
jgi:hypothetical protein